MKTAEKIVLGVHLFSAGANVINAANSVALGNSGISVFFAVAATMSLIFGIAGLCSIEDPALLPEQKNNTV